jgi:hypothetical protein
MKNLGRGAKLMYTPHPHTSGEEDGITVYVFLLETLISQLPASDPAQMGNQRTKEREGIITYKHVGSKSMFNWGV